MPRSPKSKLPRIDVMVSSTVRDLERHRDAARDAILRADMYPLRMEEAGAQTGTDAVRFSRDLVRDADVYVGLLAFHYGYIPKDDDLNPEGLSVTELEYRAWAEKSSKDGMPGFLFLQDPEHPLPRDAYDAKHIDRVEALREEIKNRHVVAFFTTPEDLRGKVLQALDRNRDEIIERLTDGATAPRAAKAEDPAEKSPPSPPAMYSVPEYGGGYEFLGRRQELDDLDRWAASDRPLMVVEAIGAWARVP